MQSLKKLDQYKILQTLEIDPNKTIIVLDSFPDKNDNFYEIKGREVILTDKNGDVLWQIDIDFSNLDQIYLSDTINNIRKTVCFVNIIKRNGEFFVKDYNGYLFSIDINTGVAHYLHWSKD